MNRLSRILLICLFLTPVLNIAQEFTTAQWQADLTFLQKTIHEEYPFLFKKTTPEAFDTAVAELQRSIPQMESHEVMVGMARLVASFGYGHTVLGYWENKVPLHELPVVLYHFDDGIYLQGVHRDYENLVGSRLVAIEGVPVEEVLKLMRPVVPAENEMFVKAYGIHYLLFPEFLHAQGVIPALKMDIELTLEKEGELTHETLKAVPSERPNRQYGMVIPGEEWVPSRDQSETPLYLKNLDRIYHFEYLPEQKTVYVRQSQIQDEKDEDIPTFYAKVFDFIADNPVEKFILDVRLNGGGNNYKNKPIVKGVIRTEKIDKPGKFIVIIGRRTFSACQNLVNELSNYTNAVFIGEPTAENINFYGDNRPVSLPNTGINAYISFAWWQDKPQWENGPWLAPHLATGMTFDQYRSNQDPALEAALQFSDSTFILDPMEHLTQLFTSGKVEAVKTEAARMIKDPNYKFFDFESVLDKTGTKLLKSNQLQEALFIYSMISEFFPDSPWIWIRYGETHQKLGDLQKASRAYQKAVALDPSGEAGMEAAKRLANMEKQPE
ncbi:MAG: tetratricopeptide repeat protein [Robiginitalea sp.]